MTRLLPFALLLTALPLLGAGCEFGADRLSRWEKDQLSSQAEKDLDNFLGEFADLGGGLEETVSARGEDTYLWEACVVGYAGCRRCYTVEGNAQGGTAAMEHVLGDDVDSCSGSLTLNDVFYGYTINDWSWDGSWAVLPDGLYDVEWDGHASSTLVIEGSDNNDGTYAFEYTMNQATGVTDGDGNLSEWTVDYDYNGFLDRDWKVVAAKDATGAINGTIVGDAASCVITGQDYDYVIDCD